MPAAERGTRARGDLLWVLGVALAAYGVGSVFELRERVTGLLAGFERWQLDELPFALGALAFALAWYAFRRRNEARDELAARVRAEDHAAQLLAHNRELAQGLIALQENERLAIARELHDELGQGCSAIRAETACLRRAAESDPQTLRAAAQRADAAAASLYQGVRALLRRLRPANLDELGLLAALQELCEAWEERSGVACVFHHDGVAGDFDDRVEITVYRVTQEALTNVMRHAAATQVRVRLLRASASEGAVLQLLVEDDGRGFDQAAPTRGLGLLGAAERAAAVGGTLSIEGRPGAGTRLSLQIPLRLPVAAAAP